jgi:acyl-CoA thioesterase FadM
VNLIFRLIAVLIAAPFRSRLDLRDMSRVRLWVLPNDLDLNMHMNNGRYLTVLDLGRIDLLIRTGLAITFIKKRWRPLIGGSLIRYRFSLRPFETFVISTRVICWNEKWIYFEHRFETRRGVAAIALTKGLVRDRIGAVNPDTILQAGGIQRQSPRNPEAVSRWMNAEEALHVLD